MITNWERDMGDAVVFFGKYPMDQFNREDPSLTTRVESLREKIRRHRDLIRAWKNQILNLSDSESGGG